MSKRDDILNETLKLISNEGFQAVTIAKILDNAKVGYGTLYNYFKSKDELLLTLYVDLRKKLAESIVFTDNGHIPKLEKFSIDYLGYCLSHYDEMKFVNDYSYLLILQDENHVYEDIFYNSLLSMLSEGMKDDVFISMKPEVLVQMINGSIMSVVSGVMSKKYEFTKEIEEDVVNALKKSILK